MSRAKPLAVLSDILDNPELTRLARKHGPKIAERVIESVLIGSAVAVKSGADSVSPKPKKPSLGHRIANFALLRVATKSVPGAIIVSGGLIAKALHDRHKAKQALHNPVKAGK